MHAVNLTHFGGFYGADRDILACEALLHSRWPDADRRREPGLMASKWWDYRLLHPAHATYLFAHELDRALKEIIRDHLDEQDRGYFAVKSGDIFEPPARQRSHAFWRRKLVGLIRARQAADEDGIPYGLFCRTGLRYFYLGGGSYLLGRTRVPEPGLLHGEKVRLVIRERWVEEIRMRVQHAAHPIYRLENDDGHPDRMAHRAWLCEQLRLRGGTAHLAAARLVRTGFLSREEAEGACDPKLLARALDRP